MNWLVNTLDTQYLFLRVSSVFTSQCMKIWLGWRLCACFSVQSPRSLAWYLRLIFAIFAMTKYHLRDFYRRLSPPTRGVRWSVLDSTLSLPLSYVTRHLADYTVRKFGFIGSAVSLICCCECLFSFIVFRFRFSCLRFISVRGKNVLFHLMYYCISWYTSVIGWHNNFGFRSLYEVWRNFLFKDTHEWTEVNFFLVLSFRACW
jgi:hypothetical protein